MARTYLLEKDGINVIHFHFVIPEKDLLNIMYKGPLIDITNPRGYDPKLRDTIEDFAIKYNCVPFGQGSRGQCYFLAEEEPYILINLKFGHVFWEI